MRRIIQLNIVGLIAFLVSNIGLAEDMAFKISGKKTSVKELYKDNESAFYELEKQKYELIEKLAKEKYLESFWGELAAKQKVSTDMAKKNYLAKKAAVGEKEINDALKRFKDHPRLKDLSETDRKKQVIDYLNSVKTREVIDSIVSGAINSKKLVITYPQPKEPVFEISVVDTDPIKYGPNPEDTKPLGCVGTKCATRPVSCLTMLSLGHRWWKNSKIVMLGIKGGLILKSLTWRLSFTLQEQPGFPKVLCSIIVILFMSSTNYNGGCLLMSTNLLFVFFH